MAARTWHSGGAIVAIGLVAVLGLACSAGKAETQEPTATQPAAAQPTATQPPATQPAATQLAATQPAATQPPAPTQPPPTPTQAPAASVAVTIIDFSYTPQQLTARAGQKVTLSLRNSGQFPHTFTIDGLVDSGRIDGGGSKTIEFTATQAGTLTFYCTIHGASRLSGTLAVSGPGAAGQPNTSDPGSASVGTTPPSDSDYSSGY